MFKLRICFVLVVLCALVQGFPRTSKKFTPKIVGGSIAPVGSVPYQVSLLSSGTYIGCGGAILSENYVITAAHCATAASNLAVRAGFNTLNKPEEGHQTVTVSQTIIHEDYDDFLLVNDIALLRLTSPLKIDTGVRTAAAKLPAAGYLASGDVIVTGWGYTWDGSDEFSNQLRKLTLAVVSDEDCRAAYGQDEIQDNMLCAGYASGGQGSCQGDSGGPLVELQSGLLVGIVSFGIGCGDPGYPEVYAETSHYIDWIKKNMT